jgi:methylenetetrahydrofolate dehydrogenase (NADP+)/methenyltetrahydrofolate cyclohydrolase
MAAQILDGKQVAKKLTDQTALQAKAWAEKAGVMPGLGVVLVGDDPASVSYVTAKERACAAVGFHSEEHRLAATATPREVLAAVERLNADPAIHGILVQLPLPRQIDEQAVIETIRPDKDVDGFTPVNIGRMMIGQSCFLPCTPHGIIQLLIDSGIETAGRHAVVVGRSNIVGKPVAHLLMRKAPGGNATVTVCHTGTRNLAEFTRQADILVVAAGRPQTVTGAMIKPGAAVIDVGVNRIQDASMAKGYRLAGDVDFTSACEDAGWITPVPGGVGPLTIAMLMQNTLAAAQRRR